MDRDMDAIRAIALALKDANRPLDRVEGIADDVFKYNGMLMIEAGLADGRFKESSRSPTPIPAAVALMRLTWSGHDFADAIKKDALWEKAKDKVLKPAGAWTFGVLTEWLKQEIKQGLGL